MISSEQCIRYAAECDELAKDLSDPDDRQPLQELASRWRELALEATGPSSALH